VCTVCLRHLCRQDSVAETRYKKERFGTLTTHGWTYSIDVSGACVWACEKERSLHWLPWTDTHTAKLYRKKTRRVFGVVTDGMDVMLWLRLTDRQTDTHSPTRTIK